MFPFSTFLSGLGLWGYAAAVVFGLTTGAFGSYEVTHAFAQNKYDRLVQKDQQAVITAMHRAQLDQQRQDKITEAHDLRLAKSQLKNHYVYSTILKEVPHAIPKEANAKCVLPYGFVRLLDAAGTGSHPDALAQATSKPDSTDAGISLSDATALLAQNLANYHDTLERLSDIQSWYADQVAAQRGGREAPSAAAGTDPAATPPAPVTTPSGDEQPKDGWLSHLWPW